MKPMGYKKYAARIEYSDEDECFVGRVAGIRDIITFHGENVAEIRHAFQEAIDFYLESCAERGDKKRTLVKLCCVSLRQHTRLWTKRLH